MATIETNFITYHLSGNDVHLRTNDGIIFISKDKGELQTSARTLRRGQKIRVEGEWEPGKALSTRVLAAVQIVAL